MATRKWKDKLSITWKGWRVSILSLFDDVPQEKYSKTEKQRIRQVVDENMSLQRISDKLSMAYSVLTFVFHHRSSG